MSFNTFLMYFVVILPMCFSDSTKLWNSKDNLDSRLFDPGTSEKSEDRWIWGYADVNESDLGSVLSTTRKIYAIEIDSVTTTTTKPTTPDPCTFVPPERDFNVTGLRISEIKCLEMHWNLKVKEARNQQIFQCSKRKKGQHGIGGRATLPGEFPHMGAIGWKATIGTWIFKCGSSLISEKFVLTAAHCSHASERDTSIADPIPQIVRFGDKTIIYRGHAKPKIIDEKIIQIIVHPKYAAPNKYYDIALMKLENEVSFTKLIKPACLWNNFDMNFVGQEATMTGWGVTENGGKVISPELQAVVVDVIHTEQCNELLGDACNKNWCGFQEHQLCAGKLAGGVDACQGDSGGPLQLKVTPSTKLGTMLYVIGITSFGIECALPNLPGVYTRVSSFVDWIEDNVWKE